MHACFAMKTRFVLAALALSLAGPLAAQVSLRPPPDTTTHPRSPDARAYAPPTPRHGHPWMGAAVGAAVGGVVGYALWRPCTGWVCIPPTPETAAVFGAAAGTLFGYVIGSAITTENRSRTAWRFRVGVTQGPGGQAALGASFAPSQAAAPHQ